MAAKYAQIRSSSASASMWFPSSSQPCATKRWRLSRDWSGGLTSGLSGKNSHSRYALSR
jgi:hypothetical protein